MKDLSRSVRASIAVFGSCLLGAALLAAPAHAEPANSEQRIEVVQPQSRSGFVKASSSQRKGIINKMQWRSYPPISPSPACWDVLLTQSNRKWGTMTMKYKRGCPVGEGFTVFRKAGNRWLELAIGGSYWECGDLQQALRRAGAPRSVVNDFTRGYC